METESTLNGMKPNGEPRVKWGTLKPKGGSVAHMFTLPSFGSAGESTGRNIEETLTEKGIMQNVEDD